MLKSYEHEGFFDEMMEPGGQVRPHYRKFRQHFKGLTHVYFIDSAVSP